MAVKSKEDLIASIKAVIGEDTTDESLTLLEDVSDTFSSLEKNDDIDWKTKYEENDRDWRKKYRDRFLGEVDEDKFVEEEERKPMTYADLFTTK